MWLALYRVSLIVMILIMYSGIRSAIETHHTQVIYEIRASTASIISENTGNALATQAMTRGINDNLANIGIFGICPDPEAH